MKKFKKLLIGMLALVSVLALSFGIAACDNRNGNNEGSGETPQSVDYHGGYWYSLMVAGGVDYGVGINLYEDGTYYAISTQVTFNGTYTATETSGTVTIDGTEYTKYYTITLSADPFTESPNGIYAGYDEHCIVADSEGDILLTDIVDGPSSQGLYNLAKQDDYLEETVVTVATYYSEDYATDFIKVELYSDNSYALDGINGAGQAGSLGTYTFSEADGVTTYTLTDEDGTTEYTITVGEAITLSDGETNYPMSATDPNTPAEVQLTLTATAQGWINAKLELYSDNTWTLSMDYTTGYNVAARGTWAMDELYNNVLTVAEDEGNIFAEDTYTLTVDYVTYEYSSTISLTLPAQAGGATVEFAFTQAAAEEAPEVQSTLTASAQGWINAKIELYDDGSWTLSMDYTTGYNVAASGTWEMDDSYNIALTVEGDDGELLAQDTYTLTVNYETYQYSATISLTLPAQAGGAATDFAFTQVIAEE